jgi:hypothetical protein
MKANLLIGAVLAVAMVAGVQPARASVWPGVSIYVIPASAPNAYGSPSYSTWNDNAIYALEHGLVSYGDAGAPSYYTQAPLVMSVLNNIVTGFNSWNGVASPGGAYASELGNRLQFGLDVKGNGVKISIDQLAFSTLSTDAGNTLGFSYGLGSYGYSSSYVGWNYGADRIRGNADDSFITSGDASQQVDEIVGRGSGNAWAAYETDPGATDQERINNAALGLGSFPFDFTGTYTYGAFQGSATVSLLPVPEPSSLAVIGFGFGALLLSRRGQSRKD